MVMITFSCFKQGVALISQCEDKNRVFTCLQAPVVSSPPLLSLFPDYVVSLVENIRVSSLDLLVFGLILCVHVVRKELRQQLT